MTVAQILTFLAPLIVVALLMRRNMRGRKLVLERLWIYPAVMVLGARCCMKGRRLRPGRFCSTQRPWPTARLSAGTARG